MIAVDTNILVYAHRRDSEWNEIAYDKLRVLAENEAPWAIPWPCLHEFFAIVTHPNIYDPPTTRRDGLQQIEYWLNSPTIALLSETRDYFDELRHLVDRAKIDGPMIHDARVAALCLTHGVRELWSADRDFSRFADLSVTNPLTGN